MNETWLMIEQTQLALPGRHNKKRWEDDGSVATSCWHIGADRAILWAGRKSLDMRLPSRDIYMTKYLISSAVGSGV